MRSFEKSPNKHKVEFLTYNEGLCVQCMHIGSYDNEPATIAAMHEYAEQNGYKLDITDGLFSALQVAAGQLRMLLRR